MSTKNHPSKGRAYLLLNRFDTLMGEVEATTDQKELYLAIGKMRFYASAALLLKRTWRLTDFGADGKPLGPKDHAEWEIIQQKLDENLRLADAAVRKRERELALAREMPP